MIGRGDELGTLERLVRGLSARRQRCLVVSGEPGIGKSALLGRLQEIARLDRCHVLSGAAADFERDVPFGLVVDALDDHVGELDDWQLRRICGSELAEVGAILPAVGHLAAAPPIRLQEERYRLHRAIRRLLSGLAAHARVVLVLDDVHWADRESLECLCHLVRHPVRANLLVAIAVRVGQCPQFLASALARAERDGAMTWLRLGPLSRDEVDELAGRGLDSRARERLYRDSGGNPFYAAALARAYRDGRGLRRMPESTIDGAVPASVLAAIEAELDALGTSDRAVLQAAAVLGDAFDTSYLARLTGSPDTAVEQALDRSAAAGLIRGDAARGAMRFRHPIVRRAAYESAPPARRRALHHRCALDLRVGGEAPATWAHHLARSALAGDQSAVDALAAAARSVAVLAPATAAHWLAVAADLLPDTAPPARRLEVLAPLATALAASGDLEASRATLGRTLELLDSGSELVRARVLAALATTDHMLGHHDSATDMLAGALDGLAAKDTAAAAELGLQLAWDHLYRSEYTEAAARAREARRISRSLGARPLIAATAAVCTLAEYNLGHLERADAAFAEGSAAVAALDDEALAARLDAVVLLGFGAHSLDRLDTGIALLQRGLDVSRATGQGQLYVPMLLALALIRLARGELVPAAALADDAEDVARLSDNPQWLSWSLTVRGTVAGLTGDPAGALRLGEEAVAAAGDVSQHYYSMVTRAYLAEARLAAGDPNGCVRDLLEICGDPGRPPIARPFRPVPYGTLTQAELARGRIDAAAAWARTATLVAERVGVPGRRGEALRARAEVALARGNAAEAVALAEAAVAAVSPAGRALDIARGQLLAGTALAAIPDPDGAARQLLAARQGFARCGARRLDDAAARLLRRVGQTAPRGGRTPGTASGTTALSPREHQVAELVVAGKTNREIASDLFLSVKTVEGHVAMLCRKLGVSRRAAVGAVMAAHHR